SSYLRLQFHLYTFLNSPKLTSVTKTINSETTLFSSQQTNQEFNTAKMPEIKIWHRTCVVCKNVEAVQQTVVNTTKDNKNNKDEAKTVVHTFCPGETLKDAVANYRCRACRSAMTLESQKLQVAIMEHRGQEQKAERSSSEEEYLTAPEDSR
ncbi:unnamed protein product, partial [Fusarium graminearum]